MLTSVEPDSSSFERSMPSAGEASFNVWRWLDPGAAIGLDTD